MRKLPIDLLDLFVVSGLAMAAAGAWSLWGWEIAAIMIGGAIFGFGLFTVIARARRG